MNSLLFIEDEDALKKGNFLYLPIATLPAQNKNDWKRMEKGSLPDYLETIIHFYVHTLAGETLFTHTNPHKLFT